MDLHERLDSKSMEIEWYKYMKVDPWLRGLWLSLWLISTIYEGYENSADACLGAFQAAIWCLGIMPVVGYNVHILLENKPANISRDETYVGNLLAGI